MKKTVLMLAMILAATTACAEPLTSLAFRNLSTGNITTYQTALFANLSSNNNLTGRYTQSRQAVLVNNNALTTCAVLVGKNMLDGYFIPQSLTTYPMTTKAGLSSTITLSSGTDYKINCYVTSDPATPRTVKVFFNGSETYVLPTSSLNLRIN